MELNLTYVLIYLDDVIIFLKTEEEHLARLQAVLDQFIQDGLKLRHLKHHFFKTKIKCLNNKVSAGDMDMGANNLDPNLAIYGYD